MKVHEQEMSSPLFENVENLKPVIQKGVSDSPPLGPHGGIDGVHVAKLVQRVVLSRQVLHGQEHDEAVCRNLRTAGHLNSLRGFDEVPERLGAGCRRDRFGDDEIAAGGVLCANDRKARSVLQ